MRIATPVSSINVIGELKKRVEDISLKKEDFASPSATEVLISPLVQPCEDRVSHHSSLK